MQFVNTNDILKNFGSEVVRKAKVELGLTRTRQRRYSTWKKTGSGFQPTSSRLKNYKGKISASGRLSDSLEYKVIKKGSDIVVRFYMESYGIYVDQGRKPGKVKRNVLDDYYSKKPIRPRALVNGRLGGFIKRNSKNLAAMNFMITRKLKYFGYEKTEFFTEPLTKMIEGLPPEIQKALIRDLEIEFTDDNT